MRGSMVVIVFTSLLSVGGCGDPAPSSGSVPPDSIRQEYLVEFAHPSVSVDNRAHWTIVATFYSGSKLLRLDEPASIFYNGVRMNYEGGNIGSDPLYSSLAASESLNESHTFEYHDPAGRVFKKTFVIHDIQFDPSTPTEISRNDPLTIRWVGPNLDNDETLEGPFFKIKGPFTNQPIVIAADKVRSGLAKKNAGDTFQFSLIRSTNKSFTQGTTAGGTFKSEVSDARKNIRVRD